MKKDLKIGRLGAVRKGRMAFLLAYVFAACLLVLLFKPHYFYSILLVLALPSLLTFSWLKKSRKKILIFSALALLLFAPPVELAARLADVWDVQSLFPRPFGEIPLENMLFAFFNFFWVLSFYEYFIDRDTNRKISPRLRYLVGLYVFAAAVVFGLYFFRRESVAMGYFTIAFTALILPAVIIFSANRHLLKKTLLPTLFFAAVFFTYELVALSVGNWWWPGEYILPMKVMGKVFPLDDVIIWYFLSTPVLIGGYEFFADDWR